VARLQNVRLDARADIFWRNICERSSSYPAEGANRYYDWQRMSIEALDPLAAGRPAVFHPYDWSAGEPSHETCEVEPTSVVIMEGLVVSRPELRHRYAVSILITVDSSQRWKRQLARHDATREWLQRWDDAERHHLTVVSPPSSFDVIVDRSVWTTHAQSRRSGPAKPLGNESMSGERGGATGRRHGDGRVARREPPGAHR
jgi:pantothenate kinase